jgi:hypothetical protein
MHGWRAAKDGELARNPERIWQSPLMQQTPERRDISEFGVRDDGRQLKPGGARVEST